jgi:hypothetical protein
MINRIDDVVLENSYAKAMICIWHVDDNAVSPWIIDGHIKYGATRELLE